MIDEYDKESFRLSVRIFAVLSVVLLSLGTRVQADDPSHGVKPFKPTIPRTWDDAVMADLELPLAEAAYSPKHVSADYYYRIPVRPIYKSYPVYHPERAPRGYMDELRQQEPAVLWDANNKRPKLETEADWIKAGELVFDSPLAIKPGRINISQKLSGLVTDPKWYERTGTPITREGILPFYRYVIREKGKVELGILSCSMCHTRIMPDGSIVKGAQGSFPFDRVFAEDYRSDRSSIVADRMLEKLLYHTPWMRPDPQAGLDHMTSEQIAAPHDTVPAGVLIRHRSRHDQPVQVPDLIGVKTRPYLDRTGLQRHRGIADLMRYAALNQRGDDLSNYGGFIPQGTFTGGKLPPDPTIPEARLLRYSDEQLYAVALYVYSLKPPPNPNVPKSAEERAMVKRGKAIFNDPVNSCYECHDPKQGYTNNKLITAPGYEPPANHPARDDIMRDAAGTPRRVGTDPGLTVTTRRGTGFYKVPSLQGVWYRGPFEHNGSVATLEDWFDSRRIQNDYVPTGWKGVPGTKTRVVKGHEFGLDLSEEDKKALISFLRTL